MFEEAFEYEGLLILYKPRNGHYFVMDINYGTNVGYVVCYEGPGWVIIPLPGSLDFGQLQALANFTSDLNATLKDQ